MSVWETREASFEKAQEIDAELRFRSLARRNKLLGLWAAEKLGISSEVTETYALRLVEAQVGNDDDEVLALELERRFVEIDPPISAHRIRRKISETTAIAAQEVFAGR